MGLSFRLTVIQRKIKKRRRRRRSEAPKIQILLPMDLVMEEILTRLPAKSLMRFKCVSKLWSSHITSRHFSNRFLTVPSRPRPRLYVCLSEFNNYHTSEILSSAPDNTTPSSFVIDYDQTILKMGKHLAHNLCGFMYYTDLKNTKIYNPTTRQLVTLPALKSDMLPLGKPHFMIRTFRRIHCYYIGHDPVNNQYKVICSIPKTFLWPWIGRLVKQLGSQYWVFVLKPGGSSWKRLAPPPLVGFCNHEPVKGGLSINGVIYYMASIGSYNSVVVSFDIRSEKFMKMIQVPHRDGDKREIRSKKLMSLIDYGGKVSVIDYTHLSDNGMVDLWVLEDTKNEEWSRKTLVLEPSQLHLVNNIVLVVKGTTQTGKVLLIPEDLMSPFHILCYDLQSNDMRKIEIKGIPDHWFSEDKKTICVDLMFMDQSESVIYLET